jgi:hypothetical protein
VQPLSTIGACCSPSPCVRPRSMRRQASMLASTALLALQCCRVQLLSTLGVSCSPSPCALARCAARLLNAGVNCASRVAVLPFAVTVCPWRQLFSVCSRSMRCQGLLCWCQLRFSRCSAAVCCRCLSAASAVLRRRVPSLDALPGFYAGFNCASRTLLALQCCLVCGHCLLSASAARRRRVLSLDALPGFYAGFNCASRVAVLPCAAAVYPRGVSCSPSPCALARCAASFYAGFNCASRVAVLPCAVAASAVFSVAVCALARCAARLLCWCQLRFSRCSAALCAVAVCSRRRLFSVAVCYRSISSVIARCAARLLRWCQLRLILALQCCRVLSLSILGVGCSPSPCVPSLDALPGF